MLEIQGSINSALTTQYGGTGTFNAVGLGGVASLNIGGNISAQILDFRSSRVVRTSHEVRPASLSANYYIAY